MNLSLLLLFCVIVQSFVSAFKSNVLRLRNRFQIQLKSPPGATKEDASTAKKFQRTFQLAAEDSADDSIESKEPNGNSMLPWDQKKLFLGRSDVTKQLYNAAKADFEEKRAARSKWSVIYASGRSGAGKSEIGIQAPREIYRQCQEGSEMKEILGNAAYLFIDMNGGGDVYSKKYDYELTPSHRMGWRLLAAVCRGSLGTKGVAELRENIAVGEGPDVVEALRGNNFNEIAALIESMHCKLDFPLMAKRVLLALSRDLRFGTICDLSGGLLNSNERVAIYVHVDEHQSMYGEGLREGATDLEKLTAHKDFLYDLCTLRGDGKTTWCNNNSIFLLPIFTGTASVVLEGLTLSTRFSKKLLLQLLPLKGEDSQKVFLNEVANIGKQLPVHKSWTVASERKTPPLHFILQELGGIPRLLENLPDDTTTMNILSKPYNYTLLQQAFDSVNTGNTAERLGEEMTRVVVSGAHLDNLNVILDGKTIAEHEFEGMIRVTGEKQGSVRLPAIDYRKSVANIAKLSSIADFANMQFDSEDWSDLWEKMCLDRFQNTLFVRSRLLKKDSTTLKELYPGCDIPAASAKIVCPTAINLVDFDYVRAMRVCNDSFIFDSTAWTAMIEDISNGECRSFKLEKDHPTFDLIHLIRDKTKLWCFLEQNKAPALPTFESRKSPGNKKTIESCKKFVPVMKEMAAAVRDQGMFLVFVPVYIDRRKKTNEGLQFYRELWAEEQFKDLPIVTTVAGSVESIPHLFPCLAHRFVLLEEEEEKKEEEEEEEQ